MMPAEWIFGVLAFLTVLGGVLAVGSAALFRAALGLMLSLLGVAGLFLLQRAEFLAVVQVLVYVGGVSVLIIFAIMLTERLGSDASSVHRGMVPAAVVVSGVLALTVVGILIQAPLPESAPAAVAARDLGAGFLGRYLVAFEAVSLLLLVAVIGALLIAKEE